MNRFSANNRRDGRPDPFLEGLLAGSLHPDEQEALCERLESNGELQDALIDLVSLDEGIAYYAQAGVVEPAAPQRGAMAESQCTESAREHSRDASPGRQLGRLAPWDASPSGGLRAAVLAAAAACFAFGVGLTVGLLPRPERPEADHAADAALVESLRHPIKAPPFGSRGDALARVAALSPAASSVGLVNSLAVGETLRCGEVIQLRTGVMEIDLEGHGRVQVEGPAEFSVVDAGVIVARYGDYVAHASGPLRLHTGNLSFDTSVCDFRVQVIGSDRTEFSVHSGSLAWRVLEESGQDHQRVRRSSADERVLVTGVGSDGIRIFPRDTVEAPKRWLADRDDLYSEYERAVLCDRPTAYWPLRNVAQNRRVLDITQNGYDGLAIGDWPSLDEIEQRPMEFASLQGTSYVEIRDKPAVDVRSGFTVEAWAMAVNDGDYRAIYSSRWTLEGYTPNQQNYGFTLFLNPDRRWSAWTGSGIYNSGWSKLAAPDDAALHQWAHLVAAFEPLAEVTPGAVQGELRLYWDGKLIGEGRRELSVREFAWPARIGATESVPKALTSWLYDGCIRDVSVYDFPLRQEVVERHFQLGRARLSEEHHSG